jgi:surface protein
MTTFLTDLLKLKGSKTRAHFQKISKYTIPKITEYATDQPLTNKTIRKAVRNYLAGGQRKKRIILNHGEISEWDVSNVTNMRALFLGATSFNQPLNKWNVSNVTNMSYMFNGATSFNQPLNKWDVSNLTNMEYMFSGATSFNLPLHEWGDKLENVTRLTTKTQTHMFSGATSFNQENAPWYRTK